MWVQKDALSVVDGRDSGKFDTGSCKNGEDALKEWAGYFFACQYFCVFPKYWRSGVIFSQFGLQNTGFTAVFLDTDAMVQ
jgi:hypothetical protein